MDIPSPITPRCVSHAPLLPAIAACALFVAATLPGQAPPTAHATTEPVRKLENYLDSFLARPADLPPSADRTLLVVLEASASVAATGFATEFEAAVTRNAADLEGAAIGLAVADQGLAVRPQGDASVVARAITQALAAPPDTPQNLMATIRLGAQALGKRGTCRQMLVVAVENAEAEDDVEATGKLLRKAGVRLHALVPEAFLADSYWAGGGEPELQNLVRTRAAPPGALLWGGDAPIVDVPHGFLFQDYDVNIVTPAGFAPYAWNRLAQVAGSGSRVYLLAGQGNWTHHCILYGYCLECQYAYVWNPTTPPTPAVPHRDHTDAYSSQRLETMAPPVCSRQEALAALDKDPLARATRAAWLAAYKAGLTRTAPPDQITAPGSARHAPTEGAVALLGEEPLARPAAYVRRAGALAEQAKAIEAQLTAAIAKAPVQSVRAAAIARFTQCSLLLTRISLLNYAHFLEHAAPAQLEQDKASGRTGASLQDRAFSICHGMAMHLRLLPSGHPAGPDMARLADCLDGFERDFGGSPIAFALRRSSLRQFGLSYPGQAPFETPDPGHAPGARPAPGRQGPRTGGK
ncbi:MAG TPA: hypothetical protein VFZ65_22290 [Planctomycetota bacterium]|nr:hypothetical protein [Planctomycetota bacterium]